MITFLKELNLWKSSFLSLMISPLIFFAISKANFDFPEAVGPAISIIFLEKFN